MIRYRLTAAGRDPVDVILRAGGLDDLATIEFEGRPDEVDALRWLLEGATGPRAERLGPRTTPRKLRHAMKFDVMLKQHQPVLVEGAQMLEAESTEQ